MTVFSFHTCPFRDHEMFAKRAPSFSQTFLKTLTILRGKKHFGVNYVHQFYLMSLITAIFLIVY